MSTEDEKKKLVSEIHIMVWDEFKKSQATVNEVKIHLMQYPDPKDTKAIEVLRAAESRLNSWATHIQEFDNHMEQVRYVHPDFGGSFDTEDEALEGWTLEVDGLAGKPQISTFSICSSCGERETELADFWGLDEWDYSPEIHYPCAHIVDYASRFKGDYVFSPESALNN